MADSTELYPYTDGALLEKPNGYMYTPYHGEPFLDRYKARREQCIAHLRQLSAQWSAPARSSVSQLLISAPRLNGDEALLELFRCEQNGVNYFWPIVSPTLEDIAHSGKASLRHLLDLMLGTRERGLHGTSIAYSKILVQLRKNFEVRRLLFTEYEKLLKRGVGDVKDAGNYVRLAALLALELDTTKALHTTNALLKINDTVINLCENLSQPIEQCLAIVSLSRELAHIDRLRSEECVR